MMAVSPSRSVNLDLTFLTVPVTHLPSNPCGTPRIAVIEQWILTVVCLLRVGYGP